MYKQPSNRSKSALRSNKSFQPLLPHESSIQYLNFLDTSSQKKDAYESPTKKILANIDIYIRIRPFLKKELISITNKKNPQFLRVPNSQTLQIVDREHQDSRQYEFHEIFNEETSQNEIFHRTCKPILDNVLQGYNAAMFVYGQTGTGKTYTMGILDRINEKSEGLVPSALKYLFRNFDGYNQDQCELSMSFYQIYLEEIQDLLNPSEGRNLGIGEDKNTGESYIKGLTVVTLQNLSQAFQLINAGLSFRNMEATKHNETSSRSHVILTINILQRKEFGESMTFSKANFIDLAGSEKPSKHSESMGGSKIDRRYEETKFINSSLSTLGTVIASLNEKGRDVTSHVAFRNSKLTRVLQSCLNGNSKICLIATISPFKDNANETIMTCAFASRCKEMKLKPSLQNVEVEGEIPRLVEYYENLLQTQKSHMKQMEQEIRLIRSNQQNSNSSVNEMLKDLNEYLCKILLSLKTKLSTQIKQIRELKPKTSSKFDLYEELNHKYPGPELLPCLETQIKENLALFEDPESCLKCIQEITKEIIQGIEEISKGCKNLEFIKQAPLKGKSQTDVNIKDNEGLYRIITFLLKMLCFQNGKTMSLEQEAEGNEKIRIYQEKFKGFLIALYGKEARIIVDIERKIDLYLKTPNPLDLEKGLEIPLLKTLSYLRKYSNNTFQDEKEEECIEIKMNERQNTQDSLKSLNSINNSSRILKESHRSMKDLINSKTQQRLLLEKQEIDYSKEGKLCKEISNFEPNLCKEISNFEQNLPIPHKKNSNTKNSINFQTSDIENNKIESSKSIIKEIKTDEIINIDEKNMNFNQEKLYKDIDFIATKKNDDKVFVNTTDIQDFNGDQPKQMSVFDNSINNYSKKCFSPETQNKTPINKLKSLSTVDNSKKDIYKLKDVTVNDKEKTKNEQKSNINQNINNSESLKKNFEDDDDKNNIKTLKETKNDSEKYIGNDIIKNSKETSKFNTKEVFKPHVSIIKQSIKNEPNISIKTFNEGKESKLIEFSDSKKPDNTNSLNYNKNNDSNSKTSNHSFEKEEKKNKVVFKLYKEHKSQKEPSKASENNEDSDLFFP